MECRLGFNFKYHMRTVELMAFFKSGMGGSGKTTLASTLCRDPQVEGGVRSGVRSGDN